MPNRPFPAKWWALATLGLDSVAIHIFSEVLLEPSVESPEPCLGFKLTFPTWKAEL